MITSTCSFLTWMLLDRMKCIWGQEKKNESFIKNALPTFLIKRGP